VTNSAREASTWCGQSSGNIHRWGGQFGCRSHNPKALALRIEEKEIFQMTKSIRALMMGAALAGFVAGQTVVAQDTGKDTAKTSGKKAGKTKKEKHACKGQNSCKGKGGCGSTKGTNDCKGKGECSTDAKHPMPKS
jgi:hypothetical protein